MKRINTVSCKNSDTARALAEIALFERIQAMFKLHPGEMAKAMRQLGKKLKKDPADLTAELHVPTRLIFNDVLSSVFYILVNGLDQELPIHSEHQDEIVKFFGLNPKTIAGSISAKAKSEGLQPHEVARCLGEVTSDVVLWAFSQTLKILEGKVD